MKRILYTLPLLTACATSIAPIEPPAPPPEYNRKEWKHWVDADKDCQDTRQEVLVEESTTLPTFEPDEKGRQCRVASGTWVDPYTNRTFTMPSSVDVDHVVPLRAAHDSGGHAWDAGRREDFANDLADPRTLRAVHLGANRSKGSKSPDQWLPENEAFRCQYIDEYLAIMDRWELQFSPEQIAVLNYMIHISNDGGVPPLPQ